jgi:hypothetical protein
VGPPSLRSGVHIVLIRGGVLRHFNSKAAPFGLPIRFASLSVMQRELCDCLTTKSVASLRVSGLTRKPPQPP